MRLRAGPPLGTTDLLWLAGAQAPIPTSLGDPGPLFRSTEQGAHWIEEEFRLAGTHRVAMEVNT